MNVIIPSLLIGIAHLATFTLPLGQVEKIGISFTCLLAYLVFQLMIVGDMPRSSDHIPLLSIYIDLQMSYLTLSLLGTGVTFIAISNIRASENGDSVDHVSRPLLALCTCVGKCFLVEKPQGNNANIDTTNNNGNNGEQETAVISPQIVEPQCDSNDLVRLEWKFVAKIVDRFVCVTYIFSLIATSIIFFIIYPKSV